jgi:hypothetical protein
MHILKGIALGFTGFLLFAALPVLVVVFTLNHTLLDPQFVNREIQKLDLPAVIQETLTNRTSAQERTFIRGIDQTITQIKPWLDRQIQLVVDAGYAYLLGQTPALAISIPTAEIEQTLLDSLTAGYLQNPPREYTSLSPAQRTQYLADLQNQFSRSFPATVEINAGTLGDEGLLALQKARDVAKFVRQTYWVTIGFVVFFILLIILILRGLKDILRLFGLIGLIAGAILTAAFFITQAVAPGLIDYGDLPAQIETWIPQVIHDVLSPGEIFSLVILIVGAALFAASFFIKTRRPAIGDRHERNR